MPAETFPLLLHFSVLFPFQCNAICKENTSKDGKSISFCEERTLAAIWLQSIPPLLPNTLMKVFFVVLSTRINSSITGPHGTGLPVLRGCPIFAIPDSGCSYVS